MDNIVERGVVLRKRVIEVPDDVWRKLGRLADGIKVCWDRHRELMQTNSEYRDVVENLKNQLNERPGQLGQILRIVSAGHTFLVKVS